MRAEEVLAGVVGADAVVLDAYSEAEYGGSGKTVDWALARSVVELARVPVVLAGGLTPDNVAAAVRAVGPAGVDVSSGVESSPGRKSEEKMAAFFSALAPFR
jgi:phosphoribosylanthranilate isomerase